MQITERIKLQIEDWRKRLIDLTRKNHLIYFNSSKKNILEVQQPELVTIFNKLFNEDNLNIFLPEEEKENNLILQQKEISKDIMNWKEKKGKFPKDNEIVFTIKDRRELEQRLRVIFRKAYSEYQEKGIWTSALVFGLLHWKEKDANLEILSPILVYPIKIEKTVSKQLYKILSADEEIIINPALKVKLQLDFGINFPTLDLELESFNLDNYFSELETLGKKMNLWKVERKIFLGNFSFHKLPMYQDLKDNVSIISEHPIVKGLTEGELIKPYELEDIPNEKDLDNNENLKKILYILDSDSSQSQAIEASRIGHSFVLEGPPGTGKSQTISNIIAEFLEEGKTVLFVSEKMAALEVVHERLKKSGLSDFCLELHSYKANKKEVVQELLRCIENNPISKQRFSDIEYERLIRDRKYINEYVLELYFIREPLGLSMYQVFGKLSKLDKVPLISIKLSSKEKYSPSVINFMEELIGRLKANWIVIKDGDDFPWRGFHYDKFSNTLIQELMSLLKNATFSVGKIQNVFADFTSTIGLNCPQTFSGCNLIIRMARKLLNNPGPNEMWITESSCKELISETKEYNLITKNYLKIKELLLLEFSDEILKLPVDIKFLFDQTWNRIKNLFFVESFDGKRFLEHRENLLNFLRKTQLCITGWIRDIEKIKDMLSVSVSKDINFERAKQITDLALLIFDENKPEKIWLDTIYLKKVEKIIEELTKYCEQYNTFNTEILTKYNSNIYTLDLDRLIDDFLGKYKFILFRLFIPKYYKDKKQLKKISHSGKIPATLVKDLKNAKDVVLLREKLNLKDKDFAESLGTYYNGFNTNIEKIYKSCLTANKVIDLVGEIPLPDKIQNFASIIGGVNPELKIIAERLKSSLLEWEKEIEEFSFIIPMKMLKTTKLPIKHSSLIQFSTWVAELINELEKLNPLVSQIIETKKNKKIENITEIIETIASLEKLKNFRNDIQNKADYLSEKFGDRFKGIGTNWEKVMDDLYWVDDFKTLIQDVSISEKFLSYVIGGRKTSEEEIIILEDIYEKTRSLLQEIEKKYDNTANLFSKFELCNLTFDKIYEKIEELITRKDDLRYWFNYMEIFSDIEKNNLGEFLKKISSLQPDSNILLDIFYKAIYESWINLICEEIPIIKSFMGHYHENVISEFRELDKKLGTLSSSLIIQKLNESKPSNINITGSAVGVIRNEVAKKRRHLPIRKIFEQISTFRL